MFNRGICDDCGERRSKRGLQVAQYKWNFRILRSSAITLNKSKHIIIIGFTSCGKTVTGKLLANLLDRDFRDTDELIEQEFVKRSNSSLSCREIYKSIGEDLFRKLESDILKHLASANPLVISTGGGTPIYPFNQEILKDMGCLVYLTATPEIIFNRMKGKGIPAFLESNPTVEGLSALLDERNQIYARICDVQIDTSELTPNEIVSEIKKKLSGQSCDRD